MSSNDQNQLTISSRKRREKLKKRKIFTKISSRKLQAAKFVQSSPKLRKSLKIVTKGCIVRHASTRTRSLAERILRATLSSRSLRIPAIRKPFPFLSKLLITGNLQVLFRDDACNSNRLFDSTKESEKKWKKLRPSYLCSSRRADETGVGVSRREIDWKEEISER